MTKEAISMSMKQNSRQDFGEVIREIDGCINALQE